MQSPCRVYQMNSSLEPVQSFSMRVQVQQMAIIATHTAAKAARLGKGCNKESMVIGCLARRLALQRQHLPCCKCLPERHSLLCFLRRHLICAALPYIFLCFDWHSGRHASHGQNSVNRPWLVFAPCFVPCALQLLLQSKACDAKPLNRLLRNSQCVCLLCSSIGCVVIAGVSATRKIIVGCQHLACLCWQRPSTCRLLARQSRAASLPLAGACRLRVAA